MKNKTNFTSKNHFGALLLFFISFFTNVYAEGETDFPPSYYDVVAVLLLLIIVITLLSIIYYEGSHKPVAVKKERILFSKISQFLTKSTPVEHENEIMFDHDSDGIRELDSKIPPWFAWLFIVTILFGVYYMLHYHVFGTGKLMYDEYNDEMTYAAAQRDELIKTGVFINEETVTLLTDASSLESGKAIFDANCVACHAADGGGIVGPNLTDNYWIHGGGIRNVFKTIKYGVPEKGMISWETQLSPEQIQQVGSYLLSLHGTTPAVPKAPEGELWTEPDKTEPGRESDVKPI